MITDPATIIYMKQIDGASYDLQSQGTGVHDMINYYVKVLACKKTEGTYHCYASESGITLYLSDGTTNDGDEGALSTMNGTSHTTRQDWRVVPVNVNTDNYFGVRPSWTVNGKNYAPFYADFAFKTASAGMKVYYISKIDYAKNVAVISEFKEQIVPKRMPVIIECSSLNPSDNKLDIVSSSASFSGTNHLGGVFFCNTAKSIYTIFDKKQMRVFGQMPDGSIGFVEGTENNTVQVPVRVRNPMTGKQEIDHYDNALYANQAYLKVNDGTASNIKIVTEEEYQQYVVHVESISLDVTEAELKIGETLKLTATVNPSNAENKSVKWSSDNEAVATVENGTVTAIAEGTATIKVVAEDGNLEATCVVTVKKEEEPHPQDPPTPVLVETISLNETVLTMIEEDTYQLVAVVAPEDADDTSVVWSSSDETIAKVTDNGLVTAVAEGQATITVKAADESGVEATCEVTVEKHIENGIADIHTAADESYFSITGIKVDSPVSGVVITRQADGKTRKTLVK